MLMLMLIMHMQKLSSIILIVSQLFFCFFIIPSFSFGADTLDVSQSLSGDQTLVSSAGNFKLGFFRPGESPNFYIGIWYARDKTNTVVWVANRETPISDKFSSNLKIIDGNLVLLNESNTQIWSTNMISTPATSASLVLLDDANLVLRYGSSSVWQSFDHPTNCFLPGSKLGYNKLTNTKQVITSWRSIEDPKEGLYSLTFDQYEKSYGLKWNRSVRYWTSGSWNGKIFSLIPEMTFEGVYKSTYVDNANETYYTYSSYGPHKVDSVSVLDVTGQLNQLIWMKSDEDGALFWAQPKSRCDVYATCGAFGACRQSGSPVCICLTGFSPRSVSEWDRSDFSGGCVRKTKLQCGRNEEKPDFLMITGMSLPPNNNSVAVGSGGECRTTCLNKCSCNAYSFVDNQCLVWDEDLLNLSGDNNPNGKTIYVKVASKDLVRQHHKKSNEFAVVGSVAGVVCFLGLILLIIYSKKRLGEKTKMEGLLVAFVYRDLQIATKNFTEKLGGGGFGSVFKGVLRDSSVVAVKKLESISQGEKQFRSEVSTIGTIQHVHLVQLRGFCAQGNKKLLVYDYMPNGSLESHLFNGNQVLNWKTRYEIAVGTARGLVYLHEKCRECIIHCDIKPENILLDANFSPKISDFGLAKLVGRDFSRVLTTIRGTRGYLAPEWLSGVAVTAKADVYSYGMLLFELVYGKRNAEQCEVSVSRFFPCLAARVLMEGGDILSLVDSRLKREACAEEVRKICQVALWCIQDEENSRPCMSEVEHILEGVLEVQMPPIPRFVQVYVDSKDPVVLFTSNKSQQLDDSFISSSSPSF